MMKKDQRKVVVKSRYSTEYKTLIAREQKLRGKYVVIIGKRVFTAKTGREATRLLAQIRKKFSQKTPLATYVPQADSLILR